MIRLQNVGYYGNTPVIGEVVKLDMDKIECSITIQDLTMYQLVNSSNYSEYRIRHLKENFFALSGDMDKLPTWVKDVVILE